LNSETAVAGAVTDCTVGGEQAAAFGFSDETHAGYHLIIAHKDFVYEIRLFGGGGISSQATADALQMIGSVAWTS
jgi:hypothetical protein